MKEYVTQILLAILLIANLWQCNSDRKSNDSVIDMVVSESRNREKMLLDKISELEKEHNSLVLDTIKINDEHEKIRNNHITDDILDSLMESIITRGKKRFH